MKNRFKMVSFVLLVLSVCAAAGFVQQHSDEAPAVVSAAGKTPLERFGQLKVKGTNLVDAKGKVFQLKGVSTHGLSWFPEYVSKEAFQNLRDSWGANAVRLAMYTAEYNGYCTGSAQNRKNLEALIDQAVGFCDDLGLYAVIDWHILSDSDPNTYKKQSKAFFKKMAQKYAGHKNIIYEICNEPNGSTTWPQIRSYADTVVRTIRRYDKKAVIIVGTPAWSQDAAAAAADPVKGSNIMYAFHFYAATHTEEYRKKLQEAVDAGLAVFVSEFGISEASGNGRIDKAQAEQWMKLLERNKISCIAWNLSNKDEACAMIDSSCTKTYGWKKSDLSESGRWIYDYMRSAAH